MNRITDAIATMTHRLKTVSDAKRKRLDAGLTLDAGEIFGWQECQARAHAEGVLSTDEAQTIFNAIRDWDDQTVPAKIIITQSIQELLAGQIAARTNRATA
jgi:ABC-type uncharacterized transport system YnjBCD substrate-binding protein